LVLPLQNGVEGLESVRSIVSSWGLGRALVGCCNIVSEIEEPGLINHSARELPNVTFGEFDGEPSWQAQKVNAIFNTCLGMEGKLEKEPMSKIWEKFVFISATTAVQAFCGPSVTQDVMATTPEILQVWRSAAQEIIALARSHGHTYEDLWLEKRVEVLRKAKGSTTSCCRDYWAGKPNELDDLVGAVVRMGEAKGVPTPIIGTLFRALLTGGECDCAEPSSPTAPLLGADGVETVLVLA
jgi:2-dehydropantoate 2-reductase